MAHFIVRETTECPPSSFYLSVGSWCSEVEEFLKGLKLQWRDKIRLNNAIWRAWYMQCKCCVAGPTTLQVLPPSRGLCTWGLEPGLGTLCVKQKSLSGNLWR